MNCELHNPADMPDVVKIDRIEEPWIKATILVPDDIWAACCSSAGTAGRAGRADLCRHRAMLVYRLPLNEVVFDFYDRLKSISRGYASFDYQMDWLSRGRPGEDVDPGERRNRSTPCPSWSTAARPSSAAGALCERLKDLIPRQLFKIAIQAAIGGKVIARETVSALRKDVTAKCYGGDVSRASANCWKSRKRAKSACANSARWRFPQSAFIAALRMGDE